MQNARTGERPTDQANRGIAMTLRIAQETRTLLGFQVLALALSLVPAANAVPPIFVPDEELAKMPVIVVGRWNKAAVESHNQCKGDVCITLESRTELVIDRVIEGKIKPGEHKILLGPFVGWQENGGEVFSFTSTEMMGDVKEVTRPNIWFLNFRRSWDKKDPNIYPSLDTYRGVQPISLEPYYLALRGANPRATVPQFLNSKDSEVLDRSLKFVCGGVLPWPYDPDEFQRFVEPRTRQFLLRGEAGAVEKLLASKDKTVRRLAASVYAELAGKKSVDRMTQLLADPDAHIRAIAIGVLAQRDAIPSEKVLMNAARGIEDGFMASKVIEALRRCKSERVVPTLISFLQNDDGGSAQTLQLPAFEAQEALKELTGHTFPLHVQTSQDAWEKTRQIPDTRRRREYLAKILPYDPAPVEAVLLRDKDKVTAVLTNSSNRTIDLMREPSVIEMVSENAQQTRWPTGSKSERESLTLRPGQSARFPVEWDKEAFEKDFESVTVTLWYLRNGNKFGVNAWMGKIVARWTSLEGSVGEKRKK